MGESLWSDLDAWQVQQVNDAVGVDSAYTTLQVQTVRACLLETLQDWDNDDYWSYPAVAVMSRDTIREFGGYGDGGLSFDKTYPYFWLVITTGEQAQATEDAKIIGKRLETLARTLSTSTLPVDDHGERQQGVMGIGNTTLMQYRRPRMTDQLHNNYDHWYILLSLALEFEGKV